MVQFPFFTSELAAILGMSEEEAEQLASEHGFKPEEADDDEVLWSLSPGDVDQLKVAVQEDGAEDASEREDMDEADDEPL